MRKSRVILAFEAKHGRPAQDVIVEAINRHASMRAAAEALGVSSNTLYYWVLRLGIRVRTVADAPARVA